MNVVLKLSGSVRGGEGLDQLNNYYYLLKKDFAAWSKLIL
jgi:hypothetical protein